MAFWQGILLHYERFSRYYNSSQLIHPGYYKYWKVCQFDILVIRKSIQSAICTIFRYMTILHPLRTVIRREYGRWIIIGLWILCTLASIPNIIHTKHFQHSYNGKDIWICHSGKIIYNHNKVAFKKHQFLYLIRYRCRRRNLSLLQSSFWYFSIFPTCSTNDLLLHECCKNNLEAEGYSNWGATLWVLTNEHQRSELVKWKEKGKIGAVLFDPSFCNFFSNLLIASWD